MEQTRDADRFRHRTCQLRNRHGLCRQQVAEMGPARPRGGFGAYPGEWLPAGWPDRRDGFLGRASWCRADRRGRHRPGLCCAHCCRHALVSGTQGDDYRGCRGRFRFWCDGLGQAGWYLGRAYRIDRAGRNIHDLWCRLCSPGADRQHLDGDATERVASGRLQAAGSEGRRRRRGVYPAGDPQDAPVLHDLSHLRGQRWGGIDVDRPHETLPDGSAAGCRLHGSGGQRHRRYCDGGFLQHRQRHRPHRLGNAERQAGTQELRHVHGGQPGRDPAVVHFHGWKRVPALSRCRADWFQFRRQLRAVSGTHCR